MTISAKSKATSIFSECAQLTFDPYWHQLFDDCSKGKFPRGSGIDATGKVVHLHSKSGKYIVYKTEGKTPETIFTDLKKLFTEELLLNSKQDRTDIREEIDNICKELQETFTGTWAQIKRKKIKDPIIRRFILDLKRKYELNNYETAEVAQIIKLGFSFNWISNEDVVYENSVITGIENLHFDPIERLFTLDEPECDYTREYKPRLFRLSGLWKKHLETPRNCYLLLS